MKETERSLVFCNAVSLRRTEQLVDDALITNFLRYAPLEPLERLAFFALQSEFFVQARPSGSVPPEMISLESSM